MHKLFLGLLIVASFLTVSCKKDEVKPKAATTLPEQPPLEPLADDFQEPDSVAPAGPADPQYGLVANGPYTLQIQLLESKSAAERVATSLKNAGIPAYVTYVVNPTPTLSGTFYRVRAGSFATTAAARHYGEINLKPLGRDFWVDLKARDSEPVKQVYTPRSTPAPTPAPAAVPAPAPVTPTPAVRAPETVRVAPTPAAPPAPAPVPAAPKAPPAPAAAAPTAPPAAPALPPPPSAPPADTGSVEDW